MKEPRKIPLTDGPKSKEVKKIRLDSIYDVDMTDDISNPADYKTFWKTFTHNEDNPQNNSQSISELESDSTD